MRKAAQYLVAVLGIATMAVGTAGAASAAVTPVRTSAVVASVQPSQGQVVGVAYPITVTFTGPVTNRTAVEKSIKVMSSKPTAGRFTWLSDTVAQWTPVGFWPAYTSVKVSIGDLSTDFQSGASVIGV